ncbi:hypothetical protein DFP93_10456 [Aneurinibacillus soli]|uniref:Uncharacterized protein n=1 Tax=Aneurinibacillus soli TaxID=1500254 RepID=A0A0U5B882_9BACL|nr:hypothetical protein [Aneurinibacillus soli]PYE62410.1 hypothetical protein DFP93_10456 [Aneurinibacillus soli]BAU26973.1 hypothetical protein CB4_01142 [Aneurinibacillus soli]
MNLHAEIFRSHLEEYPFSIDEVKQADGGWIIQTDRGCKAVLYCPDENLLRWSHSWREYLVRTGFRSVQRYLATRSGAHWITDSIGCCALFDWWEEEKSWLDDDQLRQEGYRIIGRVLGQIHAFFDERTVYYRGRYRKKGMITATRLHSACRNIHAAINQIASEPSTKDTRWLMYNITRSSERIRRAEELYKGSGVEEEVLPLSFAFVDLSSLVYWEGEWYVTGLHNPVLVPRHEDTVSLLEQIIIYDGMESVAVFLDAYFAQRTMTEAEWNYVEALLAYPYAVLTAIEEPFQPDLYERVRDALVKQVQREQLLGEMHRRRKETG